ncbi:class I SAM-dependent methyltransferase [Mycolicibacterium sp. A43C]
MNTHKDTAPQRRSPLHLLRAQRTVWVRRANYLINLYGRLGFRAFMEEILRRSLLYSRLTRFPWGRRLLFRLYYARNTWQDVDSRSGGGSNLEQTAIIRRELPALFDRLQIRTLLDAPCGDGAWWRHVDHDLARYIGVDVVADILNRQGEDPRHEFQLLDITQDQLPESDAILCRDLFIHFSENLVRVTLQNMKRSGARYLITTTYPDWDNRDIETGDFRPINLNSPPYDFPAPLEIINEGCTEAEGRYSAKSLAVWRFSDLRQIEN